MERIYGERELTAAEMVHLASVLADAGYLVGVGKNYLQFYREVTSNVILANDAGAADGAEGDEVCPGGE